MVKRTEVDAVDLFVQRLRQGVEPSGSEFREVVLTISVWLARRGLSETEREEVAADAIIRLADAVRDQRLEPSRPAGAWLRVVADHLAIDLLRVRSRRNVEFDEHIHGRPANDDEVVAMLESSAAVEDVARAMRAAVLDKKDEQVRIVAAWLDVAQAEGIAPSSRMIADRMGVSHMTVQRALRDFGARLRS